MKNFLIATAISIATLGCAYAGDAPKETKKVCIDVKDKNGNVVKDAKGKAKQNCKVMKVHKKLEGTKVPEKK